nr:MAG TPA: hypothetical protein [Caudoviricetes sp.]
MTVSAVFRWQASSRVFIPSGRLRSSRFPCA